MTRYAPEREFPPYAFLPGRDPHPTRDPAGHSFGHAEPAPPHRAPEQWREDQAYLWGADLYNHGYLWEAHEAWEGRWHVAKRDPVQAEFLQGLIQCAAACLKIRMQQPSGLLKLSELGLARLERVAARGARTYMGLDIADFSARMRSFALSAPETIDARPEISLA